MPSQRQLDANRHNAKLSRGPKTTAGRAAVRFNALKHGLTAKETVLPGEDHKEFEQFRQAFLDEHQPASPTEAVLVNQIAMSAWRLRRAQRLETDIYNIRLDDLEEEFEDSHDNYEQQDRNAYVFHDDCGGPRAFAALSRYESSHERAFYRALREIRRRPPRDPQPPQIGICETIGDYVLD